MSEFSCSTRKRRADCRSRSRPARYAAHSRCRRRVEHGGHRRVVIAVTRPDGVGLAGLAELFQRVLAHRLQQPVAGSAAGVVGDHQRLVDEQGENDQAPGSAPRHRRRRPLGRRRGRSHPKTPPAGGTTPVRVRSAAHATNPPRRATSAGGAPRCAHPRSTTGSGRAGRRGSRPATTPAPAPPPARSPAASHRGAAQISVTAAALSSVTVKSVRARRARSANNSMASSASDSDGTRHVASPVTPIGSRLVASMVSPGAAPSSSDDQLGASRRAGARSCPAPPASDGRGRTAAACPSSSGRAGRADPAHGPP